MQKNSGTSENIKQNVNGSMCIAEKCGLPLDEITDMNGKIPVNFLYRV
jgi:hypothetical protein